MSELVDKIDDCSSEIDEYRRMEISRPLKTRCRSNSKEQDVESTTAV